MRFLANRDANLHFALLTDFPTPRPRRCRRTPRSTSPQGEIADAQRALRLGAADSFFLFHRPRRWNARERVWMGYERKRGKLADLNALLRGGANASASRAIVGDIERAADVRYVITLDTDTQLPRDAARAARRHDGASAQPPALRRSGAPASSRGYGILQPRVGVSLRGARRSRYARLFGGEPGIDPYTRAVSDVYQDLFGEGSFIGKGIYDVDAFEHALGGRFPRTAS